MDNNGNQSTATATITVEDNVAPVALTQNVVVQLDATGNASITTAQVDNGSSDACGIASLSLDNSSFNCGNIGANTVTLTVMDNNGNQSTATATITVEDNVAPTALTQAIIVQLDATGNVSITANQIDSGSNDACGIASLELDNSSFNCGNVGTNTVTLTVTDNNGNQSTATAVVTVQDTVAPTAVANNLTVQLSPTGNVSITAAQINNGSSDNCGIASLSVAPAIFNCANVGTNTVTLTVTDTNGNVSTADAVVTVEDNVAPVALTHDMTAQLDATGNVSIIASQIDNGSNDACGVTLSVAPSSFDCSNIGPNTVTLTVTDNNGNVSTATAIVTVEDNVAPVALAQPVTVQLDANGNTTVTAAQVNNGSSDNCGVATMVLDTTSFDCSNVGPNTVTLTVTDVNGNSSSATATVTVEDSVLPTVVTQPVTAYLDASGSASIVVADVNNGSSDNCGIATLVLDTTSFTCSNVGLNTVVLTATDVNGNVNTATAVVTVVDEISPTINCNIYDIAPSSVPVTYTITADDNCSGATVALLGFSSHKVRNGKVVSSTCEAVINGNSITITDSGGVGNIITINTLATDSSGNTTTGDCVVNVLRGDEGVGNGSEDLNTPGHDNNGGNDNEGNGPGNPGAKSKPNKGRDKK